MGSPCGAWGRPRPREVCIRRVTLYGAAGCHLCEQARATIVAVRDEGESAFELEEVEITGDADLEARYRELLPVVEIDGRRAFFYHVPAEALRRAVGAQAARRRRGL